MQYYAHLFKKHMNYIPPVYFWVMLVAQTPFYFLMYANNVAERQANFSEPPKPLKIPQSFGCEEEDPSLIFYFFPHIIFDGMRIERDLERRRVRGKCPPCSLNHHLQSLPHIHGLAIGFLGHIFLFQVSIF